MFATVQGKDQPVRVVLVGVGPMGRNWIEALLASSDVEVVGLVDLDTQLAETVAAEYGIAGSAIGSDVADVARSSAAQAVINVTIPAAHHSVTSRALFAGLPVLSEKPVAPTLKEGISLAAISNLTGQLLMTSQSRRYFDTLSQFKSAVKGLGDIGILSTDFFKAPHFGGFRESMSHVLLADMAIHAFDVSRYILEQEPVAVYCEEFNPSWSWYKQDAAATAFFEFEQGTRFVYNGSWCSDGLETSWNGLWRASGELGTSIWDGDNAPTTELAAPNVPGSHQPSVGGSGSASQPREGIAGSLADFVEALRTGVTPETEIHSNLQSLAMVEAAVASADRRERVAVSDVIDSARDEALADESDSNIRGALESWVRFGATR
jgi:predicted dehydrogenase